MQNDYIDFKFGDHWASEFNLLAVSSSDRYTPPVYGSVNPNIATIMGKKGVYKWKTQVNEKIFNINIAFDSVTIAQLNQIKQWLQPNKIQKLIFSEEPYKYYWAALNAEIDFSHLPFIEGEKQVGERTIIEGVYKGEMVISFVCIDNDGYSTEGTFEGLETENPSSTIKGNDFVLTDADNDYIDNLKIEGKSEQETKYNNTLSDTDFADVNSRSVEKAWKTNNLAQIQAKNGEVTISAPYQYSGIAQEQREALIDHKYFAFAEINTDSLDTALEIAGKNITNSIEGKDINITDGLIGPVDDLVISGDASQDKLYNNEINSSFLEDLDNWNNQNNGKATISKQKATVTANEKYDGISQYTEENNVGDKYYIRAKVQSNNTKTALEVETEKGSAEGSSITINDASDNKLENIRIEGKHSQEHYDQKDLGEGEVISYNNTDNYERYTKVSVSGNSAQEVIEEVPGTEVEGDNLTVNGIVVTNKELDINGNVKQSIREGYNLYNYREGLRSQVSGLTIDIDEDGYIIVNGTPETNYVMINNRKIINDLLEDGETYTIYRENVNSGFYLQLDIVNKESGETTYFTFSKGQLYRNFIVDKTANDYKIMIQTGLKTAFPVLNNTKDRFMLYKGNIEKPFEQYGKAPSSKYLSPITVLGQNTNLFNATNSFQKRTVIGLTFTPIEDSSVIKVNGTATADITSFLGNDIKDIFEIGKTYYAYTNNENFEVLFELYGVDVEVPIKTVDNFVMSSEYTRINLVFKGTNLNGKTYNNEEIGIKIEKKKKTNYSPYGQGSTRIRIANKNYLDAFNYYKAGTTKTLNGITFKINEDGTITANGTATANAFFDFSYTHIIGTNKKIIINNIGGTATGTVRFTAYNKDFSTTTSVLRETTGTQEMNLSDNIEYSIFRYAVYQNTVCNNLTLGFMVLDKTETERMYIQHQEQNYILDVQKPMLKEDYFDFKNKKEIHSWSKTIFTGEEKWALNATYTNTIRFSLGVSYLNANKIGYCNRSFIRTTQAHGDYEYMFYSNDLLYFNISKSSLPADKQNLEGFTELLKQWNSEGEPLELYYQTGEVEKLALTDEQIAIGQQIDKAKLYLGTSNIYSNNEIAPYFTLVYNHILPSPSPEAPSEIQNIKNNIIIKLSNQDGSKTKQINFPLSEGQKLMKGDYLAKDGIHHVRKQIELDGTEAFITQAQIIDNIYYTALLVNDMKQLLKDNLLSNHFEGILSPSNSVGISGSHANYLYFGIDIETIGALPTQTELEKKALFKQWLAQQKIAGIPVIVEYELAEEEIEKYTETQKEMYNNLTHLIMYNGQNTLSSSNELKPQLKWEIPESPSPDYPIDVKYLGNNRNLVIKTLNNLWYNSATNKFISMPNTASAIAKIPENAYITINKKNGGNRFVVLTSDKEPEVDLDFNQVYVDNGNINRKKYTFKNLNKKWLWIGVYNAGTEEDREAALEEIKVEEGKVATKYSSNGQDTVEIKTINKNLYKPTVTSGTASGITYSIDEKGMITLNGTASSQIDIYIINSNRNNTIKNLAGKEITLKLFNSNFVLYGQLTGGRYIQGTKTLTETEEEMVNAFIRIPANTVCNNLKVYPQVELGSGTSYKEHKEEICLLNTQREMLEEDYIDLNSNMEVHNWGCKELDGTENWQLNSASTFVILNFDNMKANIGLCSHYKMAAEGVANVDYGFVISPTILYIKNKDINTVEEFKLWLTEQKEKGTPVRVYWNSDKVSGLPLTTEQKTELQKLRSYREITNIISNDILQPNMEVEYIKKPSYTTKLTGNTEELLSLIYQTNIDKTKILLNNISDNNNSFTFTHPILINLTKQFGSGKEPTKEWLDTNIDFWDVAEGGAPSIETSSRVKTVGSNINLFDPDNLIELDGQYRHYSEGEIVGSANFFGIKIPVLGNMVYSVNSNFSRNGYSNLCYYDKDFTFMWGEPFTEGQTFRTPFNCRYITLALNKNYDWFTLTYGEIPIQKVDYNLANIDMQISGYDSQFKSFPLAKGQELLQLPNGVQDTLEADGIHKRVEKIIINGTENWLKQNGVNHEKTWRFIFSRTNGSLSSAKNNCYCDKFINYSADDLWNEDIEGIAVSKSQVIIRINSKKAESVVELKQLLQDNNLVLYLPKVSEEIIPYSNAQKAWYDNFEIYRKNTQITTIAETKPWYSFTYDINDTYSVNSTKVNEYEKLGLIFNNLEDRPRFIVNRTADGSGMIKMRKPLVVDLTNVFGAGEEPDLAWCLENITFDNSCEYGTPSPNVPSELISVGSNPIKIENKSRNLIKEQNLLNWTKEYCTVERLTEKYDSRNIYRISFENHKKGTISTRIQQKKGDMVFSIYARVIQADNPTVNRLVVAKITSDSSVSTVVSHKSFENLIGEWQKIYIPITSTTISDAAELVLEIQHNADTDDSTIIDLCMPQLEEGFTPHDYIPYAPEKINNLTFTTPLRQLKNGVRDEFSKDGIIRRIGEHTIKSSDKVYWIVFNQDKSYVTICGQLGIYVRGDNSWDAPSFYCNRIEDCTSLYRIAQAKSPAPSRTKEGIGIIDSEYRMCLRADLMGIVETDTEEDMIRKYKVLLDEKPFTIYYEKEVADIEPLTELQKNTLANLVTRKQYDHWLISGDLNPEVELSYKLTSSINDIHPWVTGSNLLDKTWFYNDNNIHTKPYVEVDTGDADKSGISATRPIYLLNSGTETADLSLTFDYINIETPLTIQTYSGKFTDDGFVEETKVSEIIIEPFTNYQPFKDIYDNNPANWKIEIDSTLGEVYLRHNTDETKVLNLNRFNKDHTFLSLADCNFVDYDKVFPTIISEIEGTAIENTIFNKVIVANTADNYRLKNVNVEWKHTYL